MLFADGALSAEFRARWFSFSNPAETMLAYADLVAEHREDVELRALAVSTDDGGSSMPARSRVEHFEECSRKMSPLGEDAPVSGSMTSMFTAWRTLDRALYARLTGFWGGSGTGPLRGVAYDGVRGADGVEPCGGDPGSCCDAVDSRGDGTVLQQGLPVPGVAVAGA